MNLIPDPTGEKFVLATIMFQNKVAAIGRRYDARLIEKYTVWRILELARSVASRLVEPDKPFPPLKKWS